MCGQRDKLVGQTTYIEKVALHKDIENMKFQNIKYRLESTMIHLILILNGANINKIKLIHEETIIGKSSFGK